MTPLRQTLADMLQAQRGFQHLCDMERQWRPKDGWKPGERIIVQWRAGLAMQVREIERCSGLLSTYFPAANS